MCDQVNLDEVCHKQTFRNVRGMSALPPKAEIVECSRNVCFVPKADIDGLFDHLVGARQQGL
jgi:hypothetical protein